MVRRVLYWDLLHLHAGTREGWLLEKVDLFLKHLLDRSHLGPEGIYWDDSPNHIRGLCGFSHGAAGIGFVFLEAGRYFRNEAFYHVAEEAFRYEEHFYSDTQKNWHDFRIWNTQDYDGHKNAYLEDNIAFFTKPTFMNAWCHGAARIGLSRLRAFEVLKKDVYAQKAREAIEKTKKTEMMIGLKEDVPESTVIKAGVADLRKRLIRRTLLCDIEYARRR